MVFRVVISVGLNPIYQIENRECISDLMMIMIISPNGKKLSKEFLMGRSEDHFCLLFILTNCHYASINSPKQ
jgi:hypothetical protein